MEITSNRWPFAAPAGPKDKDDSIRAGMALCDFDTRFNRLVLQVTAIGAAAADVTWGEETRRFTADELAAGVNLAAAFEINPFSTPFAALWSAVAAKQEYETRQMQALMHGPEGRVDMEATVVLSEKVRDRLAAAVQAAHRPVAHSIVIKPASS
jgi:hypothetical protein